MLKRCILAENRKLHASPIWAMFFVLPILSATYGTFNYLQNLEILTDGWYSLWTQHTLFLFHALLPCHGRHLCCLLVAAGTSGAQLEPYHGKPRTAAGPVCRKVCGGDKAGASDPRFCVCAVRVLRQGICPSARAAAGHLTAVFTAGTAGCVGCHCRTAGCWPWSSAALPCPFFWGCWAALPASLSAPRVMGCCGPIP